MSSSVSDSPALTATTVGMYRGRENTSLTRNTKEGRTLTYDLTVIQQPERARACGSGASSYADGRPVDPPPVIELRIFEGNGADRKDVTSTYNSNFFLFTTLELAGPITQGQMKLRERQVPILFGTRVSSMAFLARPRLAGYFTFPHLSVRNEGKYRLSFNLYEEIKEDKDTDAELSNEQTRLPIPGAMFSNASISWRLEVKSAEFTVYRAKEFPGLVESTGLSKLVAEQGCRVRLRRGYSTRRKGVSKRKKSQEAIMEDEKTRADCPLSSRVYRGGKQHVNDEFSAGQVFPELERQMSQKCATPSNAVSRRQSNTTSGLAAGHQYQTRLPPFDQLTGIAPSDHAYRVQDGQTSQIPLDETEQWTRPNHPFSNYLLPCLPAPAPPATAAAPLPSIFRKRSHQVAFDLKHSNSIKLLQEWAEQRNTGAVI